MKLNFFRRRASAVTGEGRVFDYTEATRRWGHDYTLRPLENGLSAEVIGFGHWGGTRDEDRLEPGDFLRLSHPRGGQPVLYRVARIDGPGDPVDLWRAVCVWWPSREDEAREAERRGESPAEVRAYLRRAQIARRLYEKLRWESGVQPGVA